MNQEYSPKRTVKEAIIRQQNTLRWADQYSVGTDLEEMVRRLTEVEVQKQKWTIKKYGQLKYGQVK